MKEKKEILTRFGLLRHGQTEWNKLKKIQGSFDSPLTEWGKEQLTEWSLFLKTYSWDRILASDLGRVRETVAIINSKLNVPVEYTVQLREQDWGDWEGMTIPHVKKTFSEDLAHRVQMGWLFSPPNGETRQSVKKRTISELTEAARRWPGQNILIVCHQGVIKSILYSLTRRKYMPEDEKLIEPNSFHMIGYEQDRFSTIQLNIKRPT